MQSSTMSRAIINTSPARRFYSGVDKLGIKGNRQVGREGPWRGGPNNHENLFPSQSRNPDTDIVDQGELYIDAGSCLVLVLDLRLGQSGLTAAAPVDRFFTAVKAPL